jgi:hypothetical protein
MTGARPTQTALRCEVKLVAADTDRGRVMAQLRLLPMLLRPLHPTRTVQSIYLDTHEGLALEDNLAGISTRQKLRFRWYGDACDRVQGQLEWKQRENGFGDKEVFPLAALTAVAGSTRTAFWRALHEHAPPHWQQRLRGREPAQWIRYRRDYLAGSGSELRVTVDSELRASDQRFCFTLSDRRSTPLPALLIVEIKAPRSAQPAIERWLQDVDLQPGKCSKFVLSSRPGGLPLGQRYE